MSKDTDGGAKDEREKGFAEVIDWTKPEAKKLFRRVRLEGFSNDDIRRIIAEADTPQAALGRLTELADPSRRWKGRPPLPPLPPYERELEAFEEEIFERIINGECEPETVVG